jgi:hypothetical protein
MYIIYNIYIYSVDVIPSPLCGKLQQLTVDRKSFFSIITGSPARPQSSYVHVKDKAPELAWIVDSWSPLVEYQLQYRRQQVWYANNIIHTSFYIDIIICRYRFGVPNQNFIAQSNTFWRLLRTYYVCLYTYTPWWSYCPISNLRDQFAQSVLIGGGVD